MATPPPQKKPKLNIDTLSPISRVAHSKDYFSILELQAPKLDDLNVLRWNVQKHEIKKQYFKISRQVHPDRYVGNEKDMKRAADSFNIVQNAFQTLNDNIKREEYLNEYGEKLKYEVNKKKFEFNINENKDDNDEDIHLSALEKQDKDLQQSQSKRLKIKELIKKEADEYEQDMIDEFNERRRRSEMKRIRARQTKRRLRVNMNRNRNKDTSDRSDSSDSEQDSDIEYAHTLSKIKHKQRNTKRRFR